MLKLFKNKTSRAGGGTFAVGVKKSANNYAFEEYGLKPAEMAKAEKRIRAEIKKARSRGEITRFSGDIKSLKFSDVKKIKTKSARATGGIRHRRG
jgi:uncharacterized protein YicC (UPF0701 family)